MSLNKANISLPRIVVSKTTATRASTSILSLIALSACRSPYVPLDAQGTVVKGPLNNAIVFFDYNHDGVVNGSEPYTRTEEDGSFYLSGKSGYSYTVLTDETTVDASSGEILANVVLSAPSGSSIISPTTTIMDETGLNAQEVGAILGLPDGIDPTQFNPFGDNVDPEQALAVEKIAHQVMNTVTALSSAVEGAGGNIENSFKIALESVVDTVMERGESLRANPQLEISSIDFTDTEEISSIASKTAEKMDKQGIGDRGAFDKVAGQIGKAIKNVNNSVKEVKDISSVESKATFGLSSELREQIKTATKDPETNSDVIKFINSELVSEATNEKKKVLLEKLSGVESEESSIKKNSLLENLADYSGAVIKGPLENALVFLDYNKDGILDPEEPQTRTIKDGTFAFKNAKSDMPFTVLTDDTTIDTSSNQIFSGVILKSPVGSAIVSPLTTLMVEANLDAASLIKVLGLPDGIDPTQFNPFSTSVEQNSALSVEITSHQIMSTITAIRTVLEGANVDPKTSFKIAFETFAEVVKSKALLDEPVVINNTYKVTVANVDGSNKFLLNGEASPDLNLLKGQTYIFDVSDNTNTNHPFRFKDSSGKTIEVLSSGTEGQSDASVTLIVPTSGLQPALYFCTNHGEGMGADIATAESTQENPETKLKSLFDFTDPAEIRKLVDLAIEKANAQKADINEFDNEADLLSSAISNVNSSLTGSTDLLSQESIDLFSQSFLLNEQIQLFMKDTDANKQELKFADFKPIEFEIPESFSGQMIVHAGEYVHMDYAAIDADTKVTDIEFRFQNELGNSISVRDGDQEGIASARISNNQMNGSYSLKSVTVRDNGYNSNRIEYREDGTTQIYDNINHTWIYGEHSFDFATVAIKVEGGVEPQTDFTPPSLTSYSISKTEIEAGKRLKIDFEAEDLNSKLGSIDFRFQNELGNSISIYGDGQLGVASRKISQSQMNSEYKLKSIQISDTAYNSNRIEYRDDGTTQVYDNVNHKWIYGTHDFDFSEDSVTVSGGRPPQTDFTPPELVSFELEKSDVAAGKRIHIDYNATDAGSGFRQIEFRFQNEFGNSISVYDYDQDTTASTKIGKTQLVGEYKLKSIQLYDSAYSSNRIEYKDDGTTQAYDNINHTWIYGAHDFDFSIHSLNVTDYVPLPDPQTDFTPPSLVSVKFEQEKVSYNEKFSVNYEALETGSEFDNMEIRFRNSENGSSFYVYDNDDDGIAKTSINNGMNEGDYSIDFIRLRDELGNRITYKRDGTTEYTDQSTNKTVYETHDFDFDSQSVEVVSNDPPQTDWTAPVLNSLKIRDTDIVQGERLIIDYSADDVGNEINNVNFYFRNEDGNTFSINDSSDIGVAYGTPQTYQKPGTYSLYRVTLNDTAKDNNSINYKESGRTEWYDNTYKSSINGEHSFDFSKYSFNLTSPEGEQTDWEPPVLVSLAPRTEQFEHNQRGHIDYVAYDENSKVETITFYFNKENGQSISFQDSHYDGVASNSYGDWKQTGLYELERIQISDTQNQENRINYRKDGTTDFYDQQSGSYVYGEHTFDFSEYSISLVEKSSDDTARKSDLTAPELTSFSFSGINIAEFKPAETTKPEEEVIIPYPEFKAAAGDTIYISYDAVDELNEVSSVNMRFKNEDGRSIYGYDSDNDGFISVRLDNNLENGTYTLDYIQIYDDANPSNNIRYNSDGRTQYYDRVTSNTIYGNHDLPLDTFEIDIIEGKLKQTDYTPPDLSSVSLSSSNELTKIDAAAGERTKVYYTARDADSGIGNVSIEFRNETGVRIYGYDYEDDGVISLNLSSSLPNGLYSFYRMSVGDDTNSSNTKTFYDNGVSQFYDTEFRETVYNIYDVKLRDLKLNVVEGTEVQTDFTPPELTSIKMTNDEVEQGEQININYKASDLGSGIEQSYITFKNEDNGNTIYGYDYDADGIISIKVGNTQATGEYKFQSLRITDNAYQENSINYQSDGRSSYHDQAANQTVYGIYDVDVDNGAEDTTEVKLSDLSITVNAQTEKPNRDTDKDAPVLTSFAPRAENANAGEIYHIDYIAEDVGSGLSNIDMRFETEQGHSISFSDNDDDGILSKRISISQMNGDYFLKTISLRDKATEANYINYNDNGVASYNDKDLNRTLNEFHKLDFSQYKFTVKGGEKPQTDFTAPELVDFKLNGDSVLAGDEVRISYNATDKDTGIGNISFYYRTENGQSFSLSDGEDDGVAIRNMSSNQMDGVYNLQSIDVRDNANKSNSKTYYSEGHYRYRDHERNAELWGDHNFDFSKYAITVSGGTPIQTDFTPPELLSIQTEQTEVAAGDFYSLKYTASDDVSRISNAQFYFKNENGNSISFSDSGDGIASTKISTGQTTGTYSLDYIYLYDAAYSRNDIRYKSDGTTEYYDDQNRINVIDKHNFDFSSLSFTVTEATTNTEVDNNPPNLINLGIYSAENVIDLSDTKIDTPYVELPDPTFVSINQVSLTAGDRLTVHYNAKDLGEGLNNARAYFKNEAGQTFSLSDSDDDGIMSSRLSSNQVNGKYTLDYIRLEDFAYNDNYVYYRSDGRVEIYDRQNGKWIYDTHDFPLSDLTVNLSGGFQPQTDFTAPELHSISLKETSVGVGERLNVSYKASDLETGLSNIRVYFKNEAGHSFSLSDSDDDGIMTGRLGTNISNGEYHVDYIRLEDDAYSDNYAYYRKSGVIEIYDRQNGRWKYKAHDLDLENMIIKITGSEFSPQTDFQPPVLTAVSLEETSVAAGARINVNYKATDIGEGLANARIYFKNSAGNTFSISDSDDDGIMTGRVSSNQPIGEYFIDYIRLEDDAQSDNYTYYRSGGLQETYYRNDFSWFYSKHEIELDTLSIKITEGAGNQPQTDFTPPEFTSMVIDTPEVVAGDRFRIDYVAADADSDFQQASFRFTHETTNNSIYLYDYDDDGMATYKSNADLDSGIYNLIEVNLYDTESNRIEIRSNGTTGSYNNQGHVGGTHEIDFAQFAFNVTANEEPTNQQQTDFAPPELISMVTFETDSPIETIGTSDVDNIIGSLFDDIIDGLAGDDILEGGLGDDLIHGGRGNDLLSGGNGKDVFVFDIASQAEKDVITDFSTDDKVKFLITSETQKLTSDNLVNGDIVWENLTVDFTDLDVNALTDITIEYEIV